ncbi:outer membrane beta-barrel protein [Draconibacterium halophilum]|uniref:Outer membrane beta-barrel protein n=1 Tax=Draconibacterium halophilum TaxID=2706887 RepID=A0A6C0RFW4_9BACT|nr:outer membrane beta-barrel protein [Draconibacterium halophilum]QIA09300.1 outer membrane beta-barrel protein [Draconibacterium halophilum]
MKKIILLLCISVLSLSVFAQSEKGHVYLKNGSIIKGKYSYFNDRKQLKIESAGNVWIFDADEVDHIASKREGKTMFDEEAVSDIKWFFRTELGVLAGNSDNSQTAPFSITGSANYVINPNFSAGLGFGVEFLKETYMPVFANLEYRFRKQQTSPYVFLKAGYQVPIEDSNEIYYDVYPMWSSFAPWPNEIGENGFDCKGGVLINPGVGFQQMFSQTFGMNFAVGYQFHRLNYDGENDYSLDIDYNRVTVKVGIIFN